MDTNVHPATASDSDGEVFDVVGIGFGPSNLALAVTIEEEAEAAFGRPLRSLFLERKTEFAWHPSMLLEDAQIQLSFLKDMVTLRNPRSRYTFLNYLKEKGRLDQFVNLREFFPCRLEFNDYYAWVAAQMRDQARYGCEVLAIEPLAGDGGAVDFLAVTWRDHATGRTARALTRNLVVATGGVPTLPLGIDVEGSTRVFHSQDFLARVRRDFPDRDRAYRFAVVGSGQSAAEIFQYLYTNYPRAEVTAALRSFAYKPADESHFVNEIFFPQMEDFLFGLPEAKRQIILNAHRDTNYSAVDRALIQAIYRTLYAQRVAGDDRLAIRTFLELCGLEERPTGAVLEFRDVVHETKVHLEVDGAVLATGYLRHKQHPLLGALKPYLQTDAAGRYRTDRSYRVEARQGFTPRVFLQGFCEDTHGLSDTLLSTLPIRTFRIFQAFTRGGHETAPERRQAAEVAV